MHKLGIRLAQWSLALRDDSAVCFAGWEFVSDSVAIGDRDVQPGEGDCHLGAHHKAPY